MANPSVAEIGKARQPSTGAVSRAPYGTTLPTDATTALAGTFVGLGHVGSAGIQQTRAITTDDIKNMNGETVYTVQTDISRTYVFELQQYDNIDVKKAIFGAANVTATAGAPTFGARLALVDKGEPAAHAVYSFDTFRIGPTGVTEKDRAVIADGLITSVDIGPLVGTGIRSYTVTVTVYKDSSGNFVHEYSDDGVLVP